jgi:mannose-6-phosphate isomerase-like protein (cupin superfamily)
MQGVSEMSISHESSGLATTHRSYAQGNAGVDSQEFRGWFVGDFIPDEFGVRSSTDVEIKWGIHEPGEGQDGWTANRTATTISILVEGRDRIIFPDGEVILEQAGDYAIWGPGVPHRWRAIDRCVVISVRWPSTPDDSYVVDDEDFRAIQAHLEV